MTRPVSAESSLLGVSSFVPSTVLAFLALVFTVVSIVLSKMNIGYQKRDLIANFSTGLISYVFSCIAVTLTIAYIVTAVYCVAVCLFSKQGLPSCPDESATL